MSNCPFLSLCFSDVKLSKEAAATCYLFALEGHFLSLSCLHAIVFHCSCPCTHTFTVEHFEVLFFPI